MPYEYSLILFIVFLLALYLKYLYKLTIFKNSSQIVKYYAILYPIGMAWDSFAIARGHWIYPGNGISGIFIGNIPIEDFGFLFVVSYFGMVLYKLVTRKK